MTYDLKSINLPRLVGPGLRGCVALLENPVTRPLLREHLFRDIGITRLRHLAVDAPPTFYPTYPPPASAPPPVGPLAMAIPEMDGRPPGVEGFAFVRVRDYTAAYAAGRATPEAVAERVLATIAASDAGAKPLRAFIATNREDLLAQARASADRWRAGAPLSLIDGVPVAVKDEVDQVPYGTTVGTRFLGRVPAREDCTVVARLRAAGALLIGKTNMHEIGSGVTGLNSHHGTPRNPYHPDHHTGGSSSGSATAVAAGICPVAIGADGGGSIRVPAAFCGLVGLKSTFGRVSEFGVAPLCWSVGHLGPLAATVDDAALVYALIAGPDPRDPLTQQQPPVSLQGLADGDLAGVKLGMYTPWFQHADAATVKACAALVEALRGRGAQVVEVTIPDLDAARVAHLVTIAGEMAIGMDRAYRRHRRDFGLDVRLNQALIRALTARDYVQAQRVRTLTNRHFARALAQVDAIVTPTAGCLAPPIRPDAHPDGESDIRQLTEIMRFVVASNLTGLPAISVPAGYDPAGLPIGLQIIGRPWEEHRLLRLARVAESLVPRRTPHVHYCILPA